MSFFNFNKKIKIHNANEIMTTLVNKNVKLDTKIEIPDNFIGLVYYRDYYQFSLESGVYNLHKDTFTKIVQKNERKNRNTKKPRFDFNIHYVTLANLTMEVKFKKTLSFKEKVNYTLRTDYKINDALKFAKEILATSYQTNSQRTINLVYSWFKEFSDYIFNKKFKDNFHSRLKEIADKYFKRYGLTILNIKLTNDKQANSFFNNSFSSFESENQNYANENNNLNKIPQMENKFLEIENYQNEKYCPHCQSKLMTNSNYCLKCGHKIN